MEFKKTIVHKNENGVVLEDVQDCTIIIEKNKKEFNATKKTDPWSGEPFRNKVASIPLTVFDDLNKKGILRGFTVVDEKKFRAWLNDADNQYFRTRAGKI
tara:strand:- start:963 stop:1262 length:300 start_codon:yes stop_codon:yes gene_type:complete